MRKITEAIVHCTATRPEWWATRTTTQKVREIKRWHVEDRGWSDIGYHYLIDRDGTVATGRPMERDGAHVQGHNTGTIGISLFGGHGSSENDPFEKNFTPEQDKALRKLLADLQDRYGFTKITGHNQYAAKACPGFNVSRWLARKTPERSSLIESSTLKALGVSGTGVVGGTVSLMNALGPQERMVLIVAAVVIIAGILWAARERIIKWGRGVR